MGMQLPTPTAQDIEAALTTMRNGTNAYGRWIGLLDNIDSALTAIHEVLTKRTMPKSRVTCPRAGSSNCTQHRCAMLCWRSFKTHQTYWLQTRYARARGVPGQMGIDPILG
jgi:hypothetical protein